MQRDRLGVLGGLGHGEAVEERRGKGREGGEGGGDSESSEEADPVSLNYIFRSNLKAESKLQIEPCVALTVAPLSNEERDRHKYLLSLIMSAANE